MSDYRNKKYNKMQMFPQDRKDIIEEELHEPVGYKIICGYKVIKAKVYKPLNESGMSKFLVNLYNKYGNKFIIRLDEKPVLFEYMVSENKITVCKTYDIMSKDRYPLEQFFFKDNILNGIYIKYKSNSKDIKELKSYINGIIV